MIVDSDCDTLGLGSLMPAGGWVEFRLTGRMTAIWQ